MTINKVEGGRYYTLYLGNGQSKWGKYALKIKNGFRSFGAINIMIVVDYTVFVTIIYKTLY